MTYVLCAYVMLMAHVFFDEVAWRIQNKLTCGTIKYTLPYLNTYNGELYRLIWAMDIQNENILHKSKETKQKKLYRWSQAKDKWMNSPCKQTCLCFTVCTHFLNLHCCVICLIGYLCDRVYSWCAFMVVCI